MMLNRLTTFLLITFASLSQALDYEIDSEAELTLSLIDVSSGIEGLVTLHNGDAVSVSVTGVAWLPLTNATTTTNLTWSTFLNGVLVVSDTVDFTDFGKLLPSSIDVGEVTSPGTGKHTITVELVLDGVTTTIEGSYESFPSGVSMIPLIVILLLAATTQLVEVSLISGVFVGACIAAGAIKEGFYTTLDTYLLGAIANEDHAYVYLFTFTLSGLVGMMMKSGGFVGFTRSMSVWATSPRAGQMVAYVSGCLIFFDDYANTLIVGESMRPLTDVLSISREKLAFLVDATSAPVASITPISSWIGFEIGLIQTELDKIAKAHEGETITISLNGLTAFLESVKFRYYPIFLLLFIPTLVMFKRDYGPMLIAERKTQVFNRTDGGDGKTHGSGLGEKHNQPEANTPGRIWNMIIPICVLVILIIALLIESGEEPGVEQTLIDKLQNSNSYKALLYGTAAAVLLTLLMYHFQFKTDGEDVLWPTPNVLKAYVTGWCKKEDHDGARRVAPLMNVYESVDSFLYGMGHVFPATVVLTLAWASGSIMGAVGTDRLFADIISDGVAPGSLPTLSFVISFFMALATGTSWGTMAIMFPLLMTPTYNVSGGNDVIFYSTIAGILSGAVAGDHVSPISDTTVLTALATDCDLLKHVYTQSPYVLWIIVFCILVGTLPVGYGAYPNGVAYLFGYILILGFTFLVCRPVIAKNGSFDFMTELFLRYHPDHELHELKKATADAYESGAGIGTGGMFKFIKRSNDEEGETAAKGEEQPLAGDEEDAEGHVEELLDDKLLGENKLDQNVES